MNETTHTQGPWKADTNGRDVRVDSRGGLFVARTYAIPVEDNPDDAYAAEQKANAHLIAAAPELLEALKALLAQFDAGYFVRNTQSDGDPEWVIKAARSVRTLALAVQAIAKAEGKQL